MWKIAAFEFRYMLRSPQTFVTFGLFFLLAFFAMASDNVQIGAGGNVLVNSPMALLQTFLILNIFAIFAVPSFVANSVLKDFDHKFDGILFATPISKPAFLAGRFFGSFAALMLAISGAAVGSLAGTFSPYLDPETLAPTNLGHYFTAIFIYVMPVTLGISMIIFALAVATRSVMYTYLATMGLLVGYFVSNQIFGAPEYREVTSLTDPFMVRTMINATRYWTAVERNSMMPAFEGLMLYNRLVWLAVTLLVSVVVYNLFSFRQPAKQKKEKSGKGDKAEAYTPSGIVAERRFTFSSQWTVFLARTRFEMMSVFKSLPFLVIMIFSLFVLVSALLSRDVGYGLDAYPVTRIMVQAANGGLSLALLVVLIFYSADIIWRERSTHMFEIVDATPMPNWVFVVSKLFAMLGVVVAVLVIGVVSSIVVQLASGFGAQEIGLYLKRGIAVPAMNYLLLGILAVFVQVIAKNRFVGMMAMVVYMISTIILSQFGFEHPLYQYGSGIPTPMSDINGGGRFIEQMNWFFIYWGSFAVLLMIASYMLWSRGTLQPLTLRFKRLLVGTGTGLRLAALSAVLVFLSSGGYIYYNTNILNEYLTSDDIEDLQVRYEETYRQYEDMAQPRTVAVSMDVDLFPYGRRVDVAGTHVLENKTDEAIEKVHLVFPNGTEVDEVVLEGASGEMVDDTFNYHILALETPMQPGEQRTLAFKLRMEQQGFSHARNSTRLVRNGTFLNNFSLAPYIGFNPSLMLQDRNTRRQRGMEPLPRLPDLEDASQFGNNYIRQDSDFITFETTVSTVKGQTAIAPGYLQRDWVEGDRHYFEYTMDAPIMNFYSYLSAEYDVVRDDLNGMAIEVYHHKPHIYNVARMIEAVKDSITLFSEIFSPYQHKQLRIMEFPAYASFAQAFPNTVPYSESIGFIARVTGEDAIDLPYYVTSHEVAHQWWAHQVMSANTQGGTVLVETLAQYSALLVMEQEYGKDQIRKFLKYELDRYLAGRSRDPEGERPLYRVENQNYIHYRKGAVIMYALKDYLGADVVNRALSRLVQERGFTSKPYARSVDMLRLLKEEAPASQHGIIEDFFEKITLFDVMAKEARVTATADGYEVSVDVMAAKLYADAEGNETPGAFDLPVDIGIFTKSPADEGFTADDVIYLAKHDLAGGDQTLTLKLDKKPVFVGVDPYNKLIDRNSDDNIVRVEDEVQTAESDTEAEAEEEAAAGE